MTSAKEPLVRLNHILFEIDSIAEATQSKKFDDVKDDYIYTRAIERSIQIISEATKEIPPAIRSNYPDAHWKSIIDIGNLLRHEYYRIDPKIMWRIVMVHLPELRPTITRMISDLSSVS